MYRLVTLALFLSLGCVTFAFTLPQDEEAERRQSKDIVLPHQDPDSISRRDFMRTKLMYSQNILEGLTTGNFKGIEEAIKELKMVTGGAQWVAIDNPQYKKLTEDFETTMEHLSEATASRNIDATAMRFYQMSTSCIDCHKHIRKAGYRL